MAGGIEVRDSQKLVPFSDAGEQFICTSMSMAVDADSGKRHTEQTQDGSTPQRTTTKETVLCPEMHASVLLWQ